jgi:choline dehydrogenase-like flavoprotein
MQINLTEPDFDVIIVGSGIAGALAAYRLARSKVRVLILEAGGVSECRWTRAIATCPARLSC